MSEDPIPVQISIKGEELFLVCRQTEDPKISKLVSVFLSLAHVADFLASTPEVGFDVVYRSKEHYGLLLRGASFEVPPEYVGCPVYGFDEESRIDGLIDELRGRVEALKSGDKRVHVLQWLRLT